MCKTRIKKIPNEMNRLGFESIFSSLIKFRKQAPFLQSPAPRYTFL